LYVCIVKLIDKGDYPLCPMSRETELCIQYPINQKLKSDINQLFFYIQ
jgi:hypothetical protein